MLSTSRHRSRVIGTPWEGVYVAELSSDRRFHRHWHATYGIGLIAAGGHRSASGRGEVDAFAGDVITTNPGEVHDGRPIANGERSWKIMYLDPQVMAAQVGVGASPTAPSFELTRPVLQDPELRRALVGLLSHLEQWQRSPSEIERYACHEALATVCGHLIERHSTRATRRETDPELTQVRDRLADECMSPPSLADLSAMVGLSRFQLLRRFQRCYGVAPHTWLMQQRTDAARRFIAAGANLSAAAAQAGFSDQSHMTRMFMRNFGFTPGQYQLSLGHGRERPRLQSTVSR